MKQIKLLVFLFIPFFGFAQQLKQVEIQANGQLDWQYLFPMDDGVVLIYKNQFTTATVIRFDKELNLIWKSNFQVEAERTPKAFSNTKNIISILFSDNQSVIFKVFDVNLSSGEVKNSGFEIKQFFDDQDYLVVKNKVFVAGSTESGVAIYKYDKETEIGVMDSKNIGGLLSLQSFEYNEETHLIEAAYTCQKTYPQSKRQVNLKEKPVIISSEILFLQIDTTGKIVNQVNLEQQNDNHPLNAKVHRLAGDGFALSGLYRNPNGNEGVYFAKIRGAEKEFIKFYGFQELFRDVEITPDVKKVLLTQFQFKLHEIEYKDNQFVVAGEFYRPEYQTVTDFVNSPFGYGGFGGGFGGFGRGYGYDPFYGNQRTQTRQVFVGYKFANGLVYTFDNLGSLKTTHLVGVDKLSKEVSESFAFSSNNELALCKSGKILVTRLDDPGIQQNYQLSTEIDPKTKTPKAIYTTVSHWYDNIFIALGTKNIEESYQLKANELPVEKGIFGNKKTPRNAQGIRIKRTIYLTKIAS